MKKVLREANTTRPALTDKEKEKSPRMWAELLGAFSEDFQEKIEKEWNRPFIEVFNFLTSRSKRQLSFIATFEDAKATQQLVWHISQIARE